MTENSNPIGKSASNDPVALLASLAAPSGWGQPTSATGPNADRRAVHILDQVVSDNVVSFKRRRHGLRVVTSIVVAVSLGGAAVAAVLWERSPDQLSTVSCWSGPMNPPRAQVGIEWDGTTPPADGCLAAWTGGDLGGTGPPSPLQACVTDGGVTAVVPGDEAICGALGLARFIGPDAAGDDTVLLVAELEERLINQFNVGQCATPEAASRATTAAIAELELEGWTVEVPDTFSVAEPCATVAVDISVSTVFIVPVGPTD